MHGDSNIFSVIFMMKRFPVARASADKEAKEGWAIARRISS